MKTFSTKCNEEKTALFAHQESSYSAKKSHFLLIKYHGQVIKEQRFGTSGVQAFRVENKIQDFGGGGGFKEDNITQFFSFLLHSTAICQKRNQLH
jgi:hypothetical protein